jgi:hypothetical protein
MDFERAWAKKKRYTDFASSVAFTAVLVLCETLETSERGTLDSGGRTSAVEVFDRLIGNGVVLAVAQVEALRLLEIEGAGSATTEDSELVAGFVDGAVTIDAFGDGQGRPVSARRSDQLGRGTWAEAGEVGGIITGRENLQNAESVFSVGDKSKSAAGDHADFDIVDVV